MATLQHKSLWKPGILNRMLFVKNEIPLYSRVDVNIKPVKNFCLHINHISSFTNQVLFRGNSQSKWGINNNKEHIFGKYVNNVKHATFSTDSGTLLNQEIIFTSTIDYLGTRYNGSAIQNIILCHQHGSWKHSILFTSHLDIQLRNICYADRASNCIQIILFYIILLITSLPLCIICA